MLTNKQDRKFCANCGAGDTKKSKVEVYIRLPTSSTAEQQSIFQELSIYEATSTIFNFKSLQQAEDDVHMCQECLDILQDLYKNYKEFSLRRRHSCYLSGKIKELEDRITNGKQQGDGSTVELREDSQPNCDVTDCCEKGLTPSTENSDGKNTPNKVVLPSSQLTTATSLFFKSVKPQRLQKSLPPPGLNATGLQPKLVAVPVIKLSSSSPTVQQITKSSSSSSPTVQQIIKSSPSSTVQHIIMEVVQDNVSLKKLSTSPLPTTTTSKIPSKATTMTTETTAAATTITTPTTSSSTTTAAAKKSSSKSTAQPPPSQAALPRCNYCHPPKEFLTVEAVIEHVSAEPEVHNKPPNCDCAYCEMYIFLNVTKEYFTSIPKFLKLVNDAKMKSTDTTHPPSPYSELTHFTVQGTKIPTLLIKQGPFLCPFEEECDNKKFAVMDKFVQHLNKVHLRKLPLNVVLPPKRKPAPHRKQPSDDKNAAESKVAPKKPKRSYSKRKPKQFTPADCRLCSKKFVDISFLRLHQKRHRNEGGGASSAASPSPLPETEGGETPSATEDESSSEKTEQKSSQTTMQKYVCTLCHPKKIYKSSETLRDHYTGFEPHDLIEGPCDCTECQMDEFMEVIKDFVELCPNNKRTTTTKTTTKTKRRGGDLSFQKSRRRRLVFKDTSRALKIVKDPPYNCPFEGCKSRVQVFQTPDKFYEHVRIVHLVKTAVCPKCSKGLATAGQAKIHIALCDGTAVKGVVGKKKYFPPYICSVCSIEFKTRHRLRNHMVCHKARDYVCSTCGAAFKTTGYLNSHIALVHTSERPFVCEECGKSFKTNQHLKMHQTHTHTEEGRLKYNEYMRLKNRRKKLERLQREGKIVPKEEKEDEAANVEDIELEEDDGEEFDQGEVDQGEIEEYDEGEEEEDEEEDDSEMDVDDSSTSS